MYTINKLILLLMLVFCSQQLTAQTIWTEADVKNYANKNADTTQWDMKTFRHVLETSKDEDFKNLLLPISNYPSPAALQTGKPGCALLSLSFQLNNQTLSGWTVAYLKDQYNEHLFSAPAKAYRTFFTLLLVTDMDEVDENGQDSGEALATTRNYPHYTSMGAQKTSRGSIDWLQMTLADGHNLALISQQYFDLSAGQTILVAPLKDGSIRLLQIKEAPLFFTSDDLVAKLVSTQLAVNLKNNARVVEFFSQANMLK